VALVLRQYLKSASLSAGAVLGENGLFVISYLMRLCRAALLIAVWKAAMHGRASVSGMSLSALLTYTVLSEAFAEMLAGRTDLVGAFWSGSITTRYLRPMGIFSQFSAEAFGTWGLNFLLFSVPLLLLSPLFGVSPLPHHWSVLPAFCVSIVLAVAVGLAIDYLFGATAVWFELPVYAISRVRSAVTMLLSGAVIPLALMPYGVGRVLSWLPFASMASVPLRIYTGPAPVMTLLAYQAGWAAVLWFCAMQFWRACRERMVSYGG
jgi:ABC-type uncharacterized transport system permease subunit